MLKCPQFKKHLNLQTNKNCQYLKFLKSNCPNAFKSKIFNISTFLGSNCTDASNSIKYQKLVKQIVLLSAIQKKKKKKRKKKKKKLQNKPYRCLQFKNYQNKFSWYFQHKIYQKLTKQVASTFKNVFWCQTVSLLSNYKPTCIKIGLIFWLNLDY